MLVGEDASVVTIGEVKLDGVSTDSVGRLGCGLGLKHREGRRGCKGGRRTGQRFFLGALVVAGGAGALVAKIGKIVVGVMAVRPGDVESGARRDVDFDVGGLLAIVDRDGHEKDSLQSGVKKEKDTAEAPRTQRIAEEE